MSGHKRPTREETREKLRAFLKEGHVHDVASVIGHALMGEAERLKEEKTPKKPTKKKPGRKPEN